MKTENFEKLLQDAVLDYMAGDVRGVRTFAEMAMNVDHGLVVRMKDGSEFRVSIHKWER